MNHDFCYLNLNTGEIGSLRDDQAADNYFRQTTGVKIFVLPYRNIDTVWAEDNRYSELAALVSGLKEHTLELAQPSPPPAAEGLIRVPTERTRSAPRTDNLADTIDTWQPHADTFVRFTDCAGVNIEHFCRKLVDSRGATEHCLVFLHGAAFRRLHDLTVLSVTSFPSFLLRDNGRLRDDSGKWTEAIGTMEAWIGAGWLSLTQYQLCPSPSEGCDNCKDLLIQCYKRIEHQIDDECTALCDRYLRSGIKASNRVPTGTAIDATKRLVARLLTAYLPRFTESTTSPDWQAYGADADTGMLALYGPTPWANWFDPRLGPLEQDLLFESWLTPFANKENIWTLQPASLALLFWAARVMDLPFTNNPQQFIQHHDWRSWFGNRCHWDKPQPQTKSTRDSGFTPPL